MVARYRSAVGRRQRDKLGILNAREAVCRRGEPRKSRLRMAAKRGGPRVHGAGRGFTLIELLVSIFILTTGIVVVLESFQTALVAMDRTRSTQVADMLLRRRMAALDLAARTAPGEAPSSETGAFAAPHNAYRWRQIARPLREGAGNVEAAGGRTMEVVVEVWRESPAVQRRMATWYFVEAE